MSPFGFVVLERAISKITISKCAIYENAVNRLVKLQFSLLNRVRYENIDFFKKNSFPDHNFLISLSNYTYFVILFKITLLTSKIVK